MSGWVAGHPKPGWYYMYRGNGCGVFSTREEAAIARRERRIRQNFEHGTLPDWAFCFCPMPIQKENPDER